MLEISKFLDENSSIEKILVVCFDERTMDTYRCGSAEGYRVKIKSCIYISNIWIQDKNYCIIKEGFGNYLSNRF